MTLPPSPSQPPYGGQPPAPGWWLASDGRWYPPQPPQRQSTNGLAIASMILGIVWIYWIGSILALIFGYMSRRQIDQSGGSQSGRGFSTAGIVLGWIGVGLFVGFIALMVLLAAAGETYSTDGL